MPCSRRASPPRLATSCGRSWRGPDAEASWLLSRAHLQEGALPQAREALKDAGSFGDADPTLPDPAPFVGAARCAECHREKFEAQRRSRHARTFHRGSELGDLALPRPSFPDPAEPEVTHTLHKAGDRLVHETDTSGRVFKAVVDYAFGSGDRGKTLVGRSLRAGARAAAVALSRGKAVGLGRDERTSPPPRGGPGLPGDAVDRRRGPPCLGCHVTNPESLLGTPGPEAADPAIGCEKCHGPGGNHLLAAAAKFPDPAIARPSLASGARVVKICAQCHSPRGKAVSPDDPDVGPVPGHDADLEPLLHREQRQARLRDLPRPAPRRVDLGGALRGEVPGVPRRRRPGPGEGPGRRAARRDALAGLSRQSDKGLHLLPHAERQGRHAHSPFTDHFIRVHRTPPTTNAD